MACTAKHELDQAPQLLPGRVQATQLPMELDLQLQLEMQQQVMGTATSPACRACSSTFSTQRRQTACTARKAASRALPLPMLRAALLGTSRISKTASSGLFSRSTAGCSPPQPSMPLAPDEKLRPHKPPGKRLFEMLHWLVASVCAACGC